MSTRGPDHITMVTESQKVNQDVFEQVGKCCFMGSIYPLAYRAKIVGIIMKKNGGSGSLRVIDKVASEIAGSDIVIGTYNFSETLERPAFFYLSATPQVNDNHAAYITLEAKNNGQGFAEVLWAALEVS